MSLLLPLVAAGLFAAQNAPSPDELLRRVDGADASASFDAIARLVALPAERRREVEAGAAKLDPFYRDALLAELTLKSELGKLFGTESRVTWKSGPKYASAHVAELASRTGIAFAGWNDPDPATAFEVDFNGTFPMAALAHVCNEAKLRAERTPGSSQLSLHPRGHDVRPFAYRDFAFFLQNLTAEKRVDFATRPAWTLRVALTAVWDPSLPVAGWAPQAKLVEAVTESGARLEAGPAEFTGAFRHDDAEAPRVAGSDGIVALSLRVPADASAKVARLRFVATALLAKSFRDYALTPAKPKAEDGEVEVTLRRDEREVGFTVLLRPKKGKPSALAALPADFRATYKGWKETGTSAGAAVKADAVEYAVHAWPVAPPLQAPEGEGAELVGVTVRLPSAVVARPVRVELRDVPLK